MSGSSSRSVAGAADAGVEDERVEAAEALDRLGHRALGIRLDAGVGDDREPVDLGGDLLDRPGRRPVTATA